MLYVEYEFYCQHAVSCPIVLLSHVQKIMFYNCGWNFSVLGLHVLLRQTQVLSWYSGFLLLSTNHSELGLGDGAEPAQTGAGPWALCDMGTPST